MFKQALGILVGIILGIIPFVNFLGCIIYAVIKKKYIIAALVSAMLIGQIVMVSSTILKPDEERNSVIQAFSKEVDSTFSKAIVFPEVDTINSAVFNKVVNGLVEDAAVRLSRSRPDLNEMLNKLISDTLGTYEQNSFDAYSAKIFEVYKKNALTAKQKEIFKFSEADQTRISFWTRDFVQDYVMDQSRNNIGALPILMVLIYFLGTCLTIYLFKDLFVTPNTTNTFYQAPVNQQNNQQQYGQPLSEQQVSSVLNDIVQRQETPPLNTFKINLETQDNIAALNGIGAIQAMNIVNERRNNGPFNDMNDFKRRIPLSDRVYTGLQDLLNFSKPDNQQSGRGRVVEF